MIEFGVFNVKNTKSVCKIILSVSFAWKKIRKFIYNYLLRFMFEFHFILKSTFSFAPMIIISANSKTKVLYISHQYQSKRELPLNNIIRNVYFPLN